MMDALDFDSQGMMDSVAIVSCLQEEKNLALTR
jgi:hypothetical protein